MSLFLIWPLLLLQRVEGATPWKIESVDDGYVWRRSDKKNERGLDIAPFKDAVIPMFLPVEPRIGDQVTVIPDNGVPAFDLHIESTRKREDPEIGTWWEVTLETVKSGPLLSAPPRADRDEEYPVSVITIYPAVEGARGMAPATLDPASIPPATSLDLVHMAADLDGDGSADLLVAQFCCKSSAPQSARNGCDDYDDYVCSDTFLKTARGWQKVREKRP